MKFRRDPESLQALDSPPHDVGRSNAVFRSHAREGGRVFGRRILKSRVLHYDGSRPRKRLFSEALRPITPDPGRHAGARGAAPERIIPGRRFKFCGVLKDHSKGAREVLAGLVRIRAIDDRKKRPGPSLEEDKPGIRLLRIGAHFIGRIKRRKDRDAAFSFPFEEIEDRDCIGYPDFAVPVERDVAQCRSGPIPALEREEESPETLEGRVGFDIRNALGGGKVIPGRWGFAGRTHER